MQYRSMGGRWPWVSAAVLWPLLGTAAVSIGCVIRGGADAQGRRLPRQNMERRVGRVRCALQPPALAHTSSLATACLNCHVVQRPAFQCGRLDAAHVQRPVSVAVQRHRSRGGGTTPLCAADLS